MKHCKTLLTLVALLGAALPALRSQAAESGLEITDETFGCIREMTPVRGFFVANLLGELEGTLEVANSETGGRYPAGSVVQLVPGEVMVKHPEGTSPVTNDWEFFELVVSEEENRIGKRGYTDVVNRFGGNCFGCHVKAEPQWDFVCETGHGCDPLPLSDLLIGAIQKTDPRCGDRPTLTAEEREALMALQGGGAD
jgi:hypothetical protein